MAKKDRVKPKAACERLVKAFERLVDTEPEPTSVFRYIRNEVYQDAVKELLAAIPTGHMSATELGSQTNRIADQVLKALPTGVEQAKALARSLTMDLLKKLGEKPHTWHVHMRVNNLSPLGLPFEIDNVSFAVADDAQLDQMQRGSHFIISSTPHSDDEKATINKRFREYLEGEFKGRPIAAVRVQAFDDEAARYLALDSLREKLDVLNFARSLFPPYLQSWAYTDADPQPRKTFSLLYRGNDVIQPSYMTMPFETIGPLEPLRLDLLQSPPNNAATIQRLLTIAKKAPALRSAAEGKVYAAARLAGTAVTTRRRDQAFLFNVMALECLLLGEDKEAVDGPILYRLRLRCAHLLGKSFDERHKLDRAVRDLYDRRSAIVHRGVLEVSELDLERAESLISRAIRRFLTFEELLALSKEDLRQWFENAILS